jgi:NDP-sugar pyrophosphorylase family protein
LFDLSQTIAAPLFQGATYAWEVLPLISGGFAELASRLPDDFEQVVENVWVGKGTTIERTAMLKGPAIIGYDCEVRHAAFIRENAIIGNAVVIGNSTEIKNAILFNGVQVPHFNYVGDSVLGFEAHLGAGVILSNFKTTKDNIQLKDADGASIDTGLRKLGALIGDRVEVGCNAVLNPGTIIGKESVIYPLTPVRGIVPSQVILKNNGSIVPKR